MNIEALALELRNEMYDFLTELIDEFATTETISHDTFNKAVNIRSNIIADDDLWDGSPVADTEANDNKHVVIKSVCFRCNGSGKTVASDGSERDCPQCHGQTVL